MAEIISLFYIDVSLKIFSRTSKIADVVLRCQPPEFLGSADVCTPDVVSVLVTYMDDVARGTLCVTHKIAHSASPEIHLSMR
jgi:hypothetical protein